MDRTGPACSRNSRTWIRCMAKCACVRMCQLLSCCTMKTSTNGSRQQLLLGGSLFVRHLGGNPLHIHLGVHHPDLVQLDPLPRKKCKQIILPQNLEPVWMILNPWNSWRHVRHVVYLTHIKMEDFGTHRLFGIGGYFPGFPCQARFFPCKLLCWPSYLEDRSKSFQLREAEHIRLTHHVDKCDEYDYHVCVSVLCVCCVFRHCLSLHAILKNDRYIYIYIYMYILI